MSALKLTLPEAYVTGGSFSRLLPHPATIIGMDHATVLASYQRKAADECTLALLRAAGLSAEDPIPQGEAGPRVWPEGFIGSLTRKGTVVLGALAPTARLRGLGIDVERVDREVESIRQTVTPEGLPPSSCAEQGILIALSVKEAVFKAQFPLTGRILRFEEVRLSWTPDQGGLLFGSADVGGLLSCTVRCVVSGKWIVSSSVCP